MAASSYDLPPLLGLLQAIYGQAWRPQSQLVNAIAQGGLYPSGGFTPTGGITPTGGQTPRPVPGQMNYRP